MTLSNIFLRIGSQLKGLPLLFWVSASLVLGLGGFGVLYPQTLVDWGFKLNQGIFDVFGDFYLYFVSACVLGIVILAFTPMGAVRLGGPQARPNHGWFSWLSMLYCAGMGVGMMFWGAAEPLYHYLNPPLRGDISALAQANSALHISFFHWGIHPWAIYGLTAIAIGYLAFNHGKPLSISQLLLPASRRAGQQGKKRGFFIDLFTFIAILFGIAATFATGVLHLEAGSHFVFGLPMGSWTQIGIVALFTVAFLASSLSGLDSGIKRISNISMGLSFVIMGCIAVLTGITPMLGSLIQSAPQYLAQLPALSLGALDYASSDWVREWTIKYWSWWIAWAPFVGMFIAIISWGRRLRDICLAVMLIPALFCTLWFTIFGLSAIDLQLSTAFAGTSVNWDQTSSVLFAMLERLSPAAWVNQLLQWLSLILIAGFFINSADSATYTLANLSLKKTHDNQSKPPVILQLGWGLLLAVLATLFLLTGGLHLLQQVTLISVLPFTLILVALFVRFYWVLFVKDRHAGSESTLSTKGSVSPTV